MRPYLPSTIKRKTQTTGERISRKSDCSSTVPNTNLRVEVGTDNIERQVRVRVEIVVDGHVPHTGGPHVADARDCGAVASNLKSPAEAVIPTSRKPDDRDVVGNLGSKNIARRHAVETAQIAVTNRSVETASFKLHGGPKPFAASPVPPKLPLEIRSVEQLPIERAERECGANPGPRNELDVRLPPLPRRKPAGHS
jgi:hypothetical protein